MNSRRNASPRRSRSSATAQFVLQLFVGGALSLCLGFFVIAPLISRGQGPDTASSPDAAKGITTPQNPAPPVVNASPPAITTPAPSTQVYTPPQTSASSNLPPTQQPSQSLSASGASGGPTLGGDTNTTTQDPSNLDSPKSSSQNPKTITPTSPAKTSQPPSQTVVPTTPKPNSASSNKSNVVQPSTMNSDNNPATSPGTTPATPLGGN